VDPNALPRAITPRGDLAEEKKTTIALFRQASPSVVHITTLAVRQDAFSLDVFQIPQGTGSGFVWDNQGHIVTNFHVIRDADAAQVTLADHSSWKARLVGAYPDKDLAVLMVDAPKRPSAPDCHRNVPRPESGPTVTVPRNLPRRAMLPVDALIGERGKGRHERQKVRGRERIYRSAAK